MGSGSFCREGWFGAGILYFVFCICGKMKMKMKIGDGDEVGSDE